MIGRRRLGLPAVLAAALASTIPAGRLEAQASRDSASVMRAVVRRAIVDARRQAPALQRLSVSEPGRWLHPYPSDDPLPYAITADDDSLLVAAASTPICPWATAPTEGGLELGLGDPMFDGDRATVGVTFLCWWKRDVRLFFWRLRYLLRRADDGWTVERTEELGIS